VRGILEEDGMVSGGRIEDIRSLVRLAKDLEFDDNESFFAKVVAVTEGRCGSKFMNDLLTRYIFAHFNKLLHTSVSFCTLQSTFAHFSQLLHTSVNFCTLQSTFAHFSQLLHTSVSFCTLQSAFAHCIYCLWHTFVPFDVL